ncbi:DEKNAAC102634 [Brettanomyces naardenensis]|uniref:Protein-S-isoprenylcysteine O-methyltransferase n=1 Tax=Brettanomyces naardenensis TaxID=13370 RepID=A0A448YLR2_BRENA|nr:DEKNAAC102634 [Brettanomyces naardenensis]
MSSGEPPKPNPLPEISLTSFILGIVVGLSLALFFLDFKVFYLYITLIATFHFLEYYITSKYQPSKVSVDSFLINNGLEYQLAHALALTESLIEIYFFPSFKRSLLPIKLIGFFAALGGQSLRTLAMITSGENFSHTIEGTKTDAHVLVTDGIYSFSRHPSYAGFFYWALGTQLMLLNPLSFIIFLLLLYRFFGRRIRYEESTLITFFGDRYVKYRETVPVRIPFL